MEMINKKQHMGIGIYISVKENLDLEENIKIKGTTELNPSSIKVKLTANFNSIDDCKQKRVQDNNIYKFTNGDIYTEPQRFK